MARTSRSKAKKSVVSVNFEGVEASGKVAEGRHLLTVDGAPEVKTSEGSGNDYINWKFKAPGGVIYHTTSLQPQALWNLRSVLESLGLEVEESAMDLDLTELDGLTCGGEVEHETYQGKKRPRLIDIFPAEELEEAEEEDEEEEAPQPKKGSKGKKAEPEPEPEEDDLTYAEVQEMDKDELVELAEENDIKLTVKQKKNLKALRDHICAELELEEDEEEEAEEEEEEEAPRRGKKTARKAGSAELKKGSKVTFVDDGDDMEGTVKSVNTKEKFAVVDVDGEEWEVELADLTVV